MGWIGDRSQVLHYLSVVGAERDADGKFMIRNGLVLSGLDMGEVVVADAAEYSVGGGRWAPLASGLETTSAGMGIAVYNGVGSPPRPSDDVLALLHLIAHRLVVVGSTARGTEEPRDLDLLFDGDSEPAAMEIAQVVEKLGVLYTSQYPGNWTFGPESGCPFQVEILPVHRGATYRSCVRGAEERSFWGVELRVAESTKA